MWRLRFRAFSVQASTFDFCEHRAILYRHLHHSARLYVPYIMSVSCANAKIKSVAEYPAILYIPFPSCRANSYLFEVHFLKTIDTCTYPCFRSIRPQPILRTFSTSPRRLDTPAPADQPGPSTAISPKIAPIVDQISTLTLLEVSDLVSALKTRLNITEIAMPSAAPAAAAPVAAAPVEEEKPKEKTIFTVKLEKIDPAQKAKVIREVKAIMPNMNLVEVSCTRIS